METLAELEQQIITQVEINLAYYDDDDFELYHEGYFDTIDDAIHYLQQLKIRQDRLKTDIKYRRTHYEV